MIPQYTPAQREFAARRASALQRMGAAPPRPIVARTRIPLPPLPPPVPVRDWLILTDVNPRTAVARPEVNDTLPMATVLARVIEVTGVPKNEILGPRRAAKSVVARHLFFWAATKFTLASLPAIGRFCGDKDHTTVLHGARAVANVVGIDKPDVANIKGVLATAMQRMKSRKRNRHAGRSAAGRFA